MIDGLTRERLIHEGLMHLVAGRPVPAAREATATRRPVRGSRAEAGVDQLASPTSLDPTAPGRGAPPKGSDRPATTARAPAVERRQLLRAAATKEAARNEAVPTERDNTPTRVSGVAPRTRGGASGVVATTRVAALRRENELELTRLRLWRRPALACRCAS
jgi:hypothetical protein